MKISTALSGQTEIYAVLGKPIKHSLSPMIHNTAFLETGLDKVYVAFEAMPDKLKLAIDMMRAFDIKGFNLTMPLKEEVIQYLDQLSPEAELIGAVNCVDNKNGILTGYNTDSRGFALSVLKKHSQIPKRAFVLGAGGVSKAICVQLVLQGVEQIYITNRHTERAKTLADKVSVIGETKIDVIPWDRKDWEKIMPECGIIINATSLGMGNAGNMAALIPWSNISKKAIVYETIYNPLETGFLKHAREIGLSTVEGLDLLLYQGAIAFEIWTGREMPLSVVKTAMARYLSK